jgi:hypothetical protein
MKEQIDYAMRNKITAGRVQYANFIMQKQLLEARQRVSYSIVQPDNASSYLPTLIVGQVSTTAAENERYIAEAQAQIPSASATVPDAPTGLSAAAGNEHLEISFTAGSDGGSAITNYEYSLDGGAFTAFSPAQTASPLIILGLTNGTAYSVVIRAVNSVGAGASSDPVSETPSGTDTFEQFTTVGTTSWTAPTYTTSVTYLIVGGGGGSGGGYDTGAGGGGGAGEVVTGTFSVVGGTTYTITVGDGGAAGTVNRTIPSETSGGTGDSSIFATLTAVGGSGGFGSRNQIGGSGAGGAQVTTGVGGGAGRGGGSNGGGGGGGGNGSAGGSKSGSTAGIGGTGVSNSITGSAVTYGAGGGGGTGGTTNAAVAGTSNRGNGARGGGGASGQQSQGAKGGSGYVALRYNV